MGRTLGFPTANLASETQLVPRLGVYVCKTELLSTGERFLSVMNCGRRPTVAQSEPQLRIETHLLDFSRDIYDEFLKIEVLRSLREERKFAGLNELKTQIALDVANARAFFALRQHETGDIDE